MYHIVYLTTNLVNKKIYIGVHSSNKIEDNYLGSGKILAEAIRKYGKLSFERKTLFFCLSKKDALEIETRIVDGSFLLREDVYNIKLGGICGPGQKKGFKHSEISKNKISKNKKGQKMSDEFCQKRSSIMQTNNPFKGKKHSDETKEICGRSMRGKKHSDETKAIMKEKNVGRKHSDETKEKIRQLKLGKKRINIFKECPVCLRQLTIQNYQKHLNTHSSSKDESI